MIDLLPARIAAFLVPAALVLMMVVIRQFSSSWSIYLWFALPIAGVAAIAAMGIITKDASAGGQVVLCSAMLRMASSAG